MLAWYTLPELGKKPAQQAKKAKNPLPFLDYLLTSRLNVIKLTTALIRIYPKYSSLV